MLSILCGTLPAGRQVCDSSASLCEKEKIFFSQPNRKSGAKSMKTLYLVRHAKSSWGHPGLSDFNRPLLDAGIKRTRKIIKFLNEKSITVDLIISSPAVRTLATARLIASGIDYPIENIQIEPSLYEASLRDYQDLIFETPDEINSLMIVGHNYTITHVANSFLGPEIEMLPTSGLVGISFDLEHWREIPSVEPRQLFVVFPKMLKS
jgi:phosphohistidine phosphatase